MGTVEAYDGTTVMAANRTPLDREEWVADAACKGQTHLFFPPLAERPQARVRREVLDRQLCGSCPVEQQCRGFARTNREYGLWGGESEEERHLAGFTVAAPIGVRARSVSCA
jgi:WhiB family transcriptional regulator, redox-sensing transcriptional regulator